MIDEFKVLLPKEVARVLTCLYIAVDASIADDVKQTVEKGFLKYQVLLAWEAGELSEGQASKMLNIDRVSLRVMRDEYLKLLPAINP